MSTIFGLLVFVFHFASQAFALYVAVQWSWQKGFFSFMWAWLFLGFLAELIYMAIGAVIFWIADFFGNA